MSHRQIAHRFSLPVFALAAGLLCALAATAAEPMAAKHKVVLQATSSDAGVHNLVLIIASGLQKTYGTDNVAIEIVAYGDGIQMLETSSPLAERVKDLAASNVRFSACSNTLKFVEKQTGKKPLLTEGVQIVDDGVVRLVELQERGYAYIYPK